MATTTNLKMELLNTTEYITPAKINAAFSTLDRLGLDYIESESIPTGTENQEASNWWWRKWHSGRLECGVDRRFFGKKTFSKWNDGLFQSERMDFGNYPSAIKFVDHPPCVNITFSYDTQMGSNRNSWVAISGDGTTSKPPTFTIMDHSDTAIYPYAGLYAIGRWK